MGRKMKYQDCGEIHGLQLACYYAVYSYQQGLKSFLDAAGVSRDKLQVWQKKLAADVHTHYLNPYDIELIIEVTRDERLLSAVGHLAGVVWVDAEQAEAVPGDLDLLQTFGDLQTSVTAVQQHITRALNDDGEIDSVEFAQLERLLSAVGHLAGVVWVDAEQAEAVPGDLDLLQTFGDLQTSVTAVQQHITRALNDDGEIDAVEFAQLERLQQGVDLAQATVGKLVEHYRGVK